MKCHGDSVAVHASLFDTTGGSFERLSPLVLFPALLSRGASLFSAIDAQGWRELFLYSGLSSSSMVDRLSILLSTAFSLYRAQCIVNVQSFFGREPEWVVD
jgi:hypothetical protein